MINTRKLAATKTDGYWLIKIVLVCIPLLKPHLIFKKLASKRQIEILNVTISLNMFFLKYDCSQINAQISAFSYKSIAHFYTFWMSQSPYWIYFWPGKLLICNKLKMCWHLFPSSICFCLSPRLWTTTHLLTFDNTITNVLLVNTNNWINICIYYDLWLYSAAFVSSLILLYAFRILHDSSIYLT